MPAFKDDQLLIIAPGSQTTLAQLGLPESLTPARYRFRSCMFPAEKQGEFEPNKVRRKVKSSAIGSNAEGEGVVPTQGTGQEDEEEYEEDFVSEDGAVWPIKSGQVVDWPAFFALVSYIYNTINPPFHTPVLFVAEPVWTARELERITQFFFEKFKIPAFALMDSAVATSYGFGLENAIIVDVGQDKADVSAIAGFMLHSTGRAIAVPNCGGEAMTQRLVELLGGKKFTRDMCEQLKKSPICEILPSDSEIPRATPSSGDKDTHVNPAAAASTGGNEPSATATVDSTRAAGEEAGVGKGTDEDNEGVLDIASIVTGGKMNEFLESKEKEKVEKAEKAAAKKKGGDASGAAKVQRQPNSKRFKNTFIYDDKALHNALKDMNASGTQMAEMQAVMDGAGAKKSGDANGASSHNNSGPMKREIEVGIERFQAASGGLLDRLADAVFRTVSSVEEVERRSDLWNSLVIVGNGSKIRGFKEALLSRLQVKYQISPSSATIFTSELPSNMSTPLATGMNTPQPMGFGQPQMHGSSVNPLLLAATTAQNPHLNPMGQSMGGMHEHRHSSHGQTPTSIKLAKIPEYFPEWKDVGYEEASFLGAQVAAKVLFTVDTGPSKGYMTRSDYNDQGPQGIHECSL
ncbi:actin-like ATPase domain-containing protein [Myriangium duriaei CBS 260.36]|uniref:Actin-like ATPase domain-containing protein n=1 Tax=Myriangium duriaei CBS 260.36 TaxID=1168546 RepID=A0A9P4J797_9PEZI|nr:actin-like ATPase domain-containing protein [Myriangium duriaei CBS 260.36]